MYLLMEAAVNTGGKFPTLFVAVYVVGFIAALTIGSIAWYNSKRPAGWEGSDHPNIIPKFNINNNSDVQQDKS